MYVAWTFLLSNPWSEHDQVRYACVATGALEGRVRSHPPFCQTITSPHTEGYNNINAMIVIYTSNVYT